MKRAAIEAVGFLPRDVAVAGAELPQFLICPGDRRLDVDTLMICVTTAATPELMQVDPVVIHLEVSPPCACHWRQVI